MTNEDIKITTSVNIKANISFAEADLKALDALVGYGIDPFLKVFYKELGEAYMKPYEANLRALFKTIEGNVPQALVKVDQVRKTLLSSDAYRLKVGKN